MHLTFTFSCLQATDADKGDFGIVRYSLIPSVPASRFEINDDSGLVSSRVTFIDSTPDNEPFEFTVQARDTPGQASFKAAAATVIVCGNLFHLCACSIYVLTRD